ncbi:chemotaxis protein CheB [Nonomuraea gerenzanensis]|uniref:protein-glutamate methylesterase n=1 Tax=Nonomuraea gerenzanensis TaxID=93944 RepID=A0A1M4EAJ8_9ACTN|nr:chemotaxis protein CheB [Nonomuraea gerenzanensis]UBU18149.1 chemotaxis protein CheB [Nonomuraea gerenzanensis]SBO95959.1 Protein-glutamate methylesterase [Nonomuraea gerenzanensis]
MASATGRPGPAPPCPVVALVSSAGGLTATGTVLSGLPSGLAASVIVLQHLAPDHRSVLPELLGLRTGLPVAAAQDGQPLLPRRVVVAPPGRHLLVRADRRLALIPSGPFPPSRPSADLLLVSLALAAGPDAIAVVLSGRGNDSATGAAAVHHFGGTVVATDAATSDHFDMPAACIEQEETVDHVVPLDQVAALLVGLVDGLRPDGP